MRRLVAAAALAATLALPGCATTGAGGGGTVPDYILQAQALAIKICGFEPAFSTISGLWSILGSIDAVAKAICGVVVHPGASRGRSVYGVPIKGRFVRGTLVVRPR